MLFLLFELGRSRYALEAAHVIEVLPLLALAPLARAPAGVAGVFSYHGAPVPAIDLGELALGRRAAPRLSTRILLVRLGEALRVGLIAERVTQTLRREPGEFSAAAADAPGSTLLGRLLPAAGGFIQWVEPGALLPAPLRAALEALAPAPAGPPRP